MKDSILLKKADLLAKEAYKISRQFPKDELYGLTSQLRRAVLSVPLNIIEGFGRNTKNENRRFLEISYASLKETKYILYFAKGENYLGEKDYKIILSIAEEVGKILWKCISNLKN